MSLTRVYPDAYKIVQSMVDNGHSSYTVLISEPERNKLLATLFTTTDDVYTCLDLDDAISKIIVKLFLTDWTDRTAENMREHVIMCTESEMRKTIDKLFQAAVKETERQKSLEMMKDRLNTKYSDNEMNKHVYASERARDMNAAY